MLSPGLCSVGFWRMSEKGEQQSTEMQIFCESVGGLWTGNHNAFSEQPSRNRVYAGRVFFGVPLLI